MRRQYGPTGVIVVILYIFCLLRNPRRIMALHFPGPQAASQTSATKNGEHDSSADVLQPQLVTFEGACQKAMDNQVTLILTEDVTLSETIQLKCQQRLHIQGRHNADHHQQRRVKIQGDLHSLFLLNNKSQLILEHIDLDHTLETDNHKDVGAAINLRYKGNLSISQSTITSASGFCVWAVQKTNVRLKECYLLAPMRSAMVCFGQAYCVLHDCRIDQAGVHGVCARGACRIELFSCLITASAARAIYAYANASVRLKGCHISGTLHPGKAAIEISSMGCAGAGEASSSLVLGDCEVLDNLGAGIRLRGPVSYHAQGRNLLERNSFGDWDIISHPDDDNDDSEGLSKNNGELPPLRRDTAGTSFRRGDWWCTNCHKINPSNGSGNENCSICASEKSRFGLLLTMDEIRQGNQGHDFRTRLISSKQASSTTSSDTHIITPSDSIKCDVIWEFDGDNEKGWVEYDRESSLLLEDTYRQMVLSCVSKDANCRVTLSGGKYQVDLELMEQINTESQFLRLVRRRTTIA